MTTPLPEALLGVPICRRVVTIFLERLNRQKAGERAKRISFTISPKILPEFYDPEYPGAEEEMFDALEVLSRVGVIAIEYKLKRTNAPRFDRKTMLVFNACHEEACRGMLNLPALGEQQLWREALNAVELPETLHRVLKAGKPISLEGKHYPEVAKRISTMLGILQPGMTKRQISALLFWGISKVLDNRPEIVRVLQGTDLPVMLNVFGGCDQFESIRFVENYDTYVSLTRNAPAENSVLVYSAGFGGSATRIRDEAGSVVHYASDSRMGPEARQRFESWLWHQFDEAIPHFFFGDFDFSGLMIFAALRRIFPEIRLDKKYYDLMLNAVMQGHGHAPAMAAKGNQTYPGLIGDPYCDSVLLPAMREYGFYDQEGVILD